MQVVIKVILLFHLLFIPNALAEDGLVKEHYEDGTIKAEYYFQNGQKNGIAKEYFTDGKLFVESYYMNNELDGEYNQYYYTGELELTHQYKNGQINGVSKFYLEDGTLLKEEEYILGERRKLREYDLEGNLVYEKDYMINSEVDLLNEIKAQVQTNLTEDRYQGIWEPVVLSEQQYDQLLNVNLYTEDGYLKDSVGAMVVHSHGYFPSQVSFPQLDVRVESVVLPLGKNNQLASMFIQGVYDDNGKNLLANQDDNDTRSLQFKLNRTDEANMAASRMVSLKVGTPKTDISSVLGEVSLVLPTEIEKITLALENLNQRIDYDVLGVTLEKLEGNQLAIEYTGHPDMVYQTVAYDKNGQELKSISTTTSKDGLRKANNIVFSAEYDSDSTVHAVEVFVIAKSISRNIPFELTK